MGALGCGEKPTEKQLAYLREAAPKGTRCAVMAKRLGIGAQRVRLWCDDAKIARRHYVRGIGTLIGVVKKVESYQRQDPQRIHTPRIAPAYPWLFRGANTPAQLAKHRAKLEEDCFRSETHRRLLQEAAAEFDAELARPKSKGGRPRKLYPINVHSQRVA